MILQGRNLIVSANGVVLAASKSCSIDVKADTKEVSSPTDADWKHFKARAKEWSVTTNHLLKSDSVAAYTVKAVGTSHNGTGVGDQSYCTINGVRKTGGSRGLQVRIFEWDSDASRWSSKSLANYDTYGNDQAIADMCADLEDDPSDGDLIVITSHDAFTMTETLATAIETALGLPTGSVPVPTEIRSSFAAIGKYHDKGISFCNTNEGSTSHATLYLNGSLSVMSNKPVKDMLLKVGTTVTLEMQVDGFASDLLSGTAICQTARVTATLGNLMQGSWQWRGSGPLV